MLHQRLTSAILAVQAHVHLLVLLACSPAGVVIVSGCQANCPHSTERVGEVCRPRSALASVEAGSAAAEGSSQSGVTTLGDAAGQSATMVATGASAGGASGSAKGGGGETAANSSASAKTNGSGGEDAEAVGAAGAHAAAAAGGDAGEAAHAAEGAGAGGAPTCAPSAEVCDGTDNDCDGRTDEMVKTRCWADADEDGFAASDAKLVETCDECGDHSTEKEPANAASTDCDDADKTRSPSATDVCGDNVDNNCDGTPDNEANNACGGPCMMQLPGKPGESCTNGLKGACARKGTFRCESDHTLACSAESVTGKQEVCGDQSDNDCDGVMDNGCVKNACGGWSALERPPGMSCSVGEGSCRSTGSYMCRGTDDTVCTAAPKTKNGCGGCTSLPQRPGQTCSADCGGTGHWVCSGADNVICDAMAKPRNACRGCKVLVNAPGTACTGMCNAKGQYECNGEEATVCNIGMVSRNECGGCSTLKYPKGAECKGECGYPGVYECNGTEDIICKLPAGAGRNECGGCLPITAERAVGKKCTAGEGKCMGTDTYHCVMEGDQRWTFCDARAIGEGVENACGGCNLLPQTLGTACIEEFVGTPGVWACQGTDGVYCQVPSF